MTNGSANSSFAAYENQLLLDSIDDDFDWDKLLWRQRITWPHFSVPAVSAFMTMLVDIVYAVAYHVAIVRESRKWKQASLDATALKCMPPPL